MKTKLFIAAALCALAFQANAQTEKGKQLLGGGFSFSNEKTNDPASDAKVNIFHISPNYGYFFGKNFALGLNLNFTYSRQKAAQDIITAAGGSYITTRIITLDNTVHGYGFGPFVRYYANLTDKFKFFGQFTGNYGFGKTRALGSYLDASNTYNYYSANLLPGLAFFPTKKLGIELGFNLASYTKQNYKNTTAGSNYKSSHDNFNFGLNSFNPSIGVNFHL